MRQRESVRELKCDLASMLRINECTSIALKFDNLDAAFEATAMIHGNLFTSQDMGEIANAFRCNSSVRELCLDGNWGANFFAVFFWQ